MLIFFSLMAQTIARGWLARKLTGTNAGLGGVLLGFGLSMLIATPWGGVAADRLPKRAVLFASLFLFALSSAFIGLAVALDVVKYWMLIAASALQAISFAFYGPARMAFISDLVDQESLSSAIVLAQVNAEAMRVVGPAVAGVVIAAFTFGTQAVFLAGSVLTLLSLVSLIGIPSGRAAPGRPGRSPWAEMTDGIRYVRDDAALRLLVLMSLGVVMIGFAYMAFLPTLADEVFGVGSGGYGVMSAVGAGGAVATGLASALRRGRSDPWHLLFAGGLVFGASIIALGLSPSYPLALVVLALIGGASLSFQTTNQTLLLASSDFEYHGRIQSLVMLGFGGFGIAALPLGLLADAVGLRPTLVLMGAAVIGVVLVSAFCAGSARRRVTPLDLA